jgi:hypothetical protein
LLQRQWGERKRPISWDRVVGLSCQPDDRNHSDWARVAVANGQRRSSRSPAHDRPIDIHEGFAPEETCISCHGDEAAAFAKSDHAKAMTLARAATLLADFNDSCFDHDGIETRFFRKGDR